MAENEAAAVDEGTQHQGHDQPQGQAHDHGRDPAQDRAREPTQGGGQEEEAFAYGVKVEDAGPATKRVSVEIPPERIQAKLAEQFKELRREAAIPGFRPGHAPQKLIEKRFATEVREQVRRQLVSESYEQALEKNGLQVIGEPDFEQADKIQLPDAGPLSYSFSVEVQPHITLPDLKGIPVKRPRIEVKEENVDQAMKNLREQQGALVPVEDCGVEAGDYLLADVHVKEGETILAHQHDAQVVARPGSVAGIRVEDLDKQLAGLKPGETRAFPVKGPENHPNEAIRGKDVQIEVALKDIKRLELAEINAEFLEGLGFTKEPELREALREQMLERINEDVRQAMREQVNRYLLDRVQIDLPTKLSARQEDRVVSRRAMNLMMRGVARDVIEQNLDALRGGAKDEALRELKLFFILQQVATEQKVDVSEAELNGQIAMLATQRGRRPEKMKQDMTKDGSLANFYVQLREQKAVDKLLEQAAVEEVDVAAAASGAGEPATQPGGKGGAASPAGEAPAAGSEPAKADAQKE